MNAHANTAGLIPNEVVNLIFDHEWTPMRAWREYLGLTQAELAVRSGIAQSAYAQMETSANPRPAILKKISVALGVTLGQLEF